MDVELVQQLTEAFSRLGGEAKGAMIWYLVLTRLPDLILGAAWTIIGGAAVFKALKLARNLIHANHASAVLRRAAGVSVCWSRSELDRACNALSEHYHG